MEFRPRLGQVKEENTIVANKSMPRNHPSDAHKYTMIHALQKQLSILHIQQC